MLYYWPLVCQLGMVLNMPASYVLLCFVESASLNSFGFHCFDFMLLACLYLEFTISFYKNPPSDESACHVHITFFSLSMIVTNNGDAMEVEASLTCPQLWG